MKKIGLVGGISWTSTVDYYRFINEEANKKLGKLNFAECIIYSVNFEKFASSNAAHDWDATYQLLLSAVQHLEDAGAELILLGANTAHIVADKIAAATKLPLIDIRTATVLEIHKWNLKKVGLLGTVYTMELDFYKDKLLEEGIDVITPQDKADRDYIEDTLVHELGKGIINTSTKSKYLKITDTLIQQGVEGIILGCTEIPLMLSQQDFKVPVFNTTKIHASAAVEFALSNL